MGINISMVLSITKAILAAAEKIVQETANGTDDQVVKVAKLIVDALAGVYGDPIADLPDDMVTAAYTAAGELKAEYGIDA